jgi:hypothetical protein
MNTTNAEVKSARQYIFNTEAILHISMNAGI